MTSLRLEGRKRWLTWCACWLALSACRAAELEQGGQAPSALAGQGGGPGLSGVASGEAPSAGASGAADPGEDAYRVDLHADDITLCPGQCTQLHAEAANGTPPYRYAWNQAGMEGAGPFEVCPAQTTSYEVIATDALSTLEEFGGEDQKASSTLQIVVTDDCEQPDGGVDGPAHEPGQPICELRFRSEGTSWFHPAWSSGALRSVGTDAQGNLYFVGWMSGGTTRIGNLSVEGSDNLDGLVAKLSPACEPIWLKPLRTTLEGSLTLKAIAVSPSGADIYVTGNLEGSASFGGTTFVGGPGLRTGVLFRLDGEGELVWAEAASGPSIAQLNDVDIADNGDVIVTGFGLDGATFAGLGAATSERSWSAFVARVRSDGTGVFFHATPHGSEELSAAVLPSGSIALMGSDLVTVPLTLAGGVIDVPDNARAVYVAVLEANGDFVWGKAVRLGPEHGWTSFISTTMTVDQAGRLLIDESHYEDPPSGTRISTPPELIRLDDAGNELWSRERPYRRTSDNHWTGGIAVDAEGSILVLDEAVGGETAESGETLETNGYNDFMLSKRSEDGEPIWIWQSGGDAHDWCWGLAIDARGATWVGSGSSDLSTGDGEYVVTRIAP